MKIGVIAVQGAVSEHVEVTKRALEEIGISGEVFYMHGPQEVDAIIIPGGESTTITALMESTGLLDFVKNFEGPIMGTCAGLIALSKEGAGDAKKTGQPFLGKLNCRVNRNAFGRQRESFEADLNIPFLDAPFRGVFIRAPAVEEVFEGCNVICKFEGKIVGVEQGNVLGLSFHPELADDIRIHKYFLNKIGNQ